MPLLPTLCAREKVEWRSYIVNFWTRAPSLHSTFFIFMQFSAKFGTPFGNGAPLIGNSRSAAGHACPFFYHQQDFKSTPNFCLFAQSIRLILFQISISQSQHNCFTDFFVNRKLEVELIFFCSKTIFQWRIQHFPDERWGGGRGHSTHLHTHARLTRMPSNSRMRTTHFSGCLYWGAHPGRGVCLERVRLLGLVASGGMCASRGEVCLQGCVIDSPRTQSQTPPLDPEADPTPPNPEADPLPQTQKQTPPVDRMTNTQV